MSIQSAPRPTRNASLLSFFVFPVPVTVGVCTTGWAKCCEVRLGESAHIHETYRTLLSKPPKCACYAAALPISKVIDPHITKHSRSASFSRDCPHYRPRPPSRQGLSNLIHWALLRSSYVLKLRILFTIEDRRGHQEGSFQYFVG